jgi:hypothetical protein
MTKEEGSVQLADAAWTFRGAFAKSHSINFPHPGGSGRQVTYNPVSRADRWRSYTTLILICPPSGMFLICLAKSASHKTNSKTAIARMERGSVESATKGGYTDRS